MSKCLQKGVLSSLYIIYDKRVQPNCNNVIIHLQIRKRVILCKKIFFYCF